MGSFKSTILTQKAHALMAKLTVGTATSAFTKIKSSDHDYSALTSSQLEALTALEEIKQEVSVSEVKRINDASVKVTGTILNTELTEGYYIKAIGLYANDPDEGEILYSITVAIESDWMPPYNSISSASALYDLVTTVSNAENVSIDVDPNAVVSITQFNEFKENVNSQLSEKVNQDVLGYATPEMFGAKGDGVSDDTSAIQQAINEGDVILLSKKYLVSKTGTKNIVLKGFTIPISIEIPSNKKIIISGSIVTTNEAFNVFYSEGDDIKICGGKITLPVISSSGTYQMGCVALNGSEHVDIENIVSNNAIVTCFSCNYITTSKCISIRDNNNSMNCAIGYHNTSYSQMLYNVVIGTHNDGDLITFGSCYANIIDGNTLIAKCDYYTDLGAQGICIDSGNYKTKVINNHLTGYYNPIDVKTWANGNIISGNTLLANKQGITIRRGEGNQSNFVDMITNNYIDLGGGNGSATTIVGSESITGSTYNTCGIYIESVSSVIISDNIIETTVDTPNGIGIMLKDIMDDATIKIDNNKFSSMHFEGYTRYFKGVFIMSNGTTTKKAWVSITNNEFSLGDPADNYVQYFNLRYIKRVTISGNIFTGGTVAPLLNNCPCVFLTGNNGEINTNLARIENSSIVMMSGNSILNTNNGAITHVLDLSSVTNSISNGNSIFSTTTSLVDTGCTHSTDTIINS